MSPVFKERKQSGSGTRIPIWPMLVFLYIAIEKLWFYHTHDLLAFLEPFMGHNGFDALATILIEDLSVLGLIALLSIAPKGWLRLGANLAILIICLYFLVDMKSVKALHFRFTLPLLISFSEEIPSVMLFLTKTDFITLSLLAAICVLLRKRTIPVPVRAEFTAAVLLLIGFMPSLLFHDRPLNPMVDMGTRNFLRLNRLVWFDRRLPPERIQALKEKHPEMAAQIDPSLESEAVTALAWGGERPNIILLVSESLSQVDSMRSGGIFDRLPLIDRMQADGLTLTNVVSNGPASKEAMAALLLGYESVPTRKLYGDMPRQFPGDGKRGRNIVTLAKRKGYSTSSVSNTNIYFQFTGRWKKQIGFDLVLGARSKIMRKYPSVHFTCCPSDEHLFFEALKMVDRKKDPYLMMLTTISLHQPYSVPDFEGKREEDDSLTNLLRYVDGTTYEFYTALKERNFFENGVLMVVGDHRRMDPLEPEEVERRGELDAYGRVVCSIIGKGFKPGSMDGTPLNHSDLNLLLCTILQGGKVGIDALPRLNKSHYLGIEKPFSTHLISYDFGLVVLRIEDEEPRFLHLSSALNPDDYSSNPVAEKAAAYLMLSMDWLYQRQKQVELAHQR